MIILIVGGSYQGKSDVAKKYIENNSENCELILHFERLVREIFDQYEDWSSESKTLFAEESGSFTDKLTAKAMDGTTVVITADEIGSGIVPLERRERDFRDIYGALTRRIAEKADRVIRVTAGIEMVLK